MKVLLVEDDPLFARMIAAVFANEPDDVISHEWASSLQEGLAKLKASAFDIILLDLMLGDSRGLDTVRSMRAASEGIPIVVLTGMNSRELGSESIRLGAHDFQVKGGEPACIIRALRNAIERNRIQRELIAAQQSLRSAEAALIQAEKMESVGRLAAGVAHEVKNPLAIIQMGVDALRHMPGNDAELPLSILKDMAEAVTRASGIVNGLLNFSQPTQPGKADQTDIPSLLDDALRMVMHDARKKHIQVEKSYQAEIPDLHLDRRSVLQVFVNLFLNAIQAMPEEGRLTVTATSQCLDKVGNGVGRRASDQFRLGQRVVRVAVQDSGPGIPEEILPKIFDPFFTTKAQGEGTGLGLYVCRNIVNLHGGRITMENIPGGGALATITFVA